MNLSRISLIALIGLVLLQLISCGGGGTSSGPSTKTTDTTPPTVVSTSPANGTTCVSAITIVQVTFSESVLASTINTTTFTLTPSAGGAAVNGTVTISGMTATFTLSASLSANTQYTASISTGVQDVAHNSLATPYSWSFTTASGSGGTSGALSYMFYTAGNVGAGGVLDALDPATPTSPITVESSGYSRFLAQITAGTYSSTTNTWSDRHAYAFVYLKSDGMFYKVSALTGSSPMPAQLSTQTGVGSDNSKFCDLKVYQDYANPDNSVLIYKLPGTFICGVGGDYYSMVKLGMDATSDPIPVSIPGTPVYDWSNGAISGWLVYDNGPELCDVNYANCTALNAYAGGAITAGSNPQRFQLLCTSAGVQVYDSSANILSASVYPSCPYYYNNKLFDGNNFYFADQVAGEGYNIFSVPADVSATAATQLTASNSESVGIDSMAVTLNRIVYYSKAGLIKSIDKNAVMATPTTLIDPSASNLTFPIVLKPNFSIFSVSGNHVYYNLYGTNTGNLAGVIDDDGSNRSETANATWLASMPGSSLSFANGDLNHLKYLLRDEIDTTQAGVFNETLKTYDMETDTEVATVGVLVGTAPTFASVATSCGAVGSGTNALCADQDVFYFNLLTPNSLVKVQDVQNDKFPFWLN